VNVSKISHLTVLIHLKTMTVTLHSVYVYYELAVMPQTGKFRMYM